MGEMKESVVDGEGEGLKKLEGKLLPRMTQATAQGPRALDVMTTI
jgi:hypothetical protein